MHTTQTPSQPRGALWRPARRRRFTPQEVRQRLQLHDPEQPRTAAVHAAAAQTGLWSGLLTAKVARELGRAGNRLPSIVFWYSRGVPIQAIGRRISPFSSEWDAERAIGVAVALIAETLNRTDLAKLAA